MRKYILQFSLLLALLCPSISSAGKYVIINQVMYDTPLSEESGKQGCYNGEFFELYNGGKDDVSLSGWSIHSLSGKNTVETYDLPNVIIPSGGYLIFASRYGKGDNFEMEDFYPIENQEHPEIIYNNKIILSNKKETLILENPYGETADQIVFGSDTKLKAGNSNGISGSNCRSLHRTGVEYDENGYIVHAKSQWVTDKVSFGENRLQNPMFGTQTVVSFKPSVNSTSTMNGNNYILRISPLDYMSNVKMSDDGISVDANIRTCATIEYMDGLGRTEQAIALGASPTGKDVVSFVEYQETNNTSRQWLPIEMQTEGQRTDLATIKEQVKTDYADDYPYAETRYNKAARTIEQTRPGKEYTIHPKKEIHGFNAADEVRMYTVKDTSLHYEGLYYAAATLHKTTIMDEDGKSVITYTDKSGRKIMEKHGDGDTYYVYDDLERLRFILPNVGSNFNIAKDYALSDRTLKAIAYCYQYDAHGNMIYKRHPGCEPQYMVYDVMGQLVLLSNGNQRKNNKWTLCSYDNLGRSTYLAEVVLQREHDFLLDTFADEWQVGDKALSVLGITNKDMLIENFYDSYNFPGVEDVKYRHDIGYYNPHQEDFTGLLTGTRVYNLSEEGYTTTAYYYDAKGRVEQTHSRCSTDGRTIVTSARYHFDGTIDRTITEQCIGDDKVIERYRYDYDHAGRLLKTYYQLNSDPEITLSEFSYDKTGHLAQNLLHNQKDKIEYSYDMRNMLTETKSKHFTEKLLYANPPRSMIAKPCYNGNISAVEMSFDDKDAEPYRFDFIYDDQNRLIVMDERVYDDKTGMVTVAPIESFAYDDMGNITSIKRWYYNNRRNISRFLCVADLQYHYGNEGNQLLSVVNNGNPMDKNNFLDYHDRSKEEIEMSYDANGNLKSDADRKITEIRYNILNLPEYIEFSTGHRVVNMYDAAGKKYKSIYFTNLLAGSSVSEIANHEYEFSPEEEGCRITEYFGSITKEQKMRSSSWETTQTIHNAIGYYKNGVHYHYLKDHLGNVCAVVSSETDQVVQKTVYYASGVPMTYSTNRGVQPYLYNGKEFVEDPGYDVYDYGFRGYYATIGRFTSMDPLCEQTPWQSPYVYAGNNFVNCIDYMGLSVQYSIMAESSREFKDDLDWCSSHAGGNVGGGFLGFNPYVYVFDTYICYPFYASEIDVFMAFECIAPYIHRGTTSLNNNRGAISLSSNSRGSTTRSGEVPECRPDAIHSPTNTTMLPQQMPQEAYTRMITEYANKMQGTFPTDKEIFLQNVPEQDRLVVTNPAVQVTAASVFIIGAIPYVATACTWTMTTGWQAFAASQPAQFAAGFIEGYGKGNINASPDVPFLYESPAYQAGSAVGSWVYEVTH